MRRAAISSLRLLRAEAAEATPAVSESLRSSPAGEADVKTSLPTLFSCLRLPSTLGLGSTL